MSIAERGVLQRTFGTGGSEPYARALRQFARGPLTLHEAAPHQSSPTPRTSAIEMDVDRWSNPANSTDLALLNAVTGPVLDVGCGPGRMVRGAVARGLEVLGIDVSPAAIEVARAAHLPVAQVSVFDAVPNEGNWHTVLLVDGNIGIGGDVAALLQRCRELIRPAGEIVAELHLDASTDRAYLATLVDVDGLCSAQFPWAEVGLDRIAQLAPRHRLELRQFWVREGRSFCRLAATGN